MIMKKYFMKILLSFVIIVIGLIAYLVYRPAKNDNSRRDTNIQKPSRIVSLAPNITEILFALGLGDNIAAVSNDSDYPPQAKTKKDIGSFWQPSTEAIIATQPDLIIAEKTEQQLAVADTLKRVGYNVLIIKTEKIEDLYPAIEEIGKATCCAEKANVLVANTKERIKYYKQKFLAAKKVKTLWIIQMEPLRAVGRDTFINELIEIAGGENAIGPTVFEYPQLSTEQLLGCQAEVIIQSVMVKENLAAEEKIAKEFWQRMPSLPAVKNQRIYLCDSDATLRLGPRITEAIDYIAKLLHPQMLRDKTAAEPNVK